MDHVTRAMTLSTVSFPKANTWYSLQPHKIRFSNSSLLSLPCSRVSSEPAMYTRQIDLPRYTECISGLNYKYLRSFSISVHI